jgi:hypothetical protein
VTIGNRRRRRGPDLRAGAVLPRRDEVTDSPDGGRFHRGRFA